MAEYFIGDDYYSETSSVKDQETRKVKDILIDNKNIHFLSRHKYDRDNEKQIHYKIKCYTSGQQGNVIKNAQFGTEYIYGYSERANQYVLIGNNFKPTTTKKNIFHKVGSFDEDLYYKVVVCTGENKKAREPIVLFYNTPEQFERHHGIRVSQEDKNNWYEKKKRQMLTYKFNFIYKEELPELTVVEHMGSNVVIH
jgi:hypothetical protein